MRFANVPPSQPKRGVYEEPPADPRNIVPLPSIKVSSNDPNIPDPNRDFTARRNELHIEANIARDSTDQVQISDEQVWASLDARPPVNTEAGPSDINPGPINSVSETNNSIITPINREEELHYGATGYITSNDATVAGPSNSLVGSSNRREESSYIIPDGNNTAEAGPSNININSVESTEISNNNNTNQSNQDSRPS
jgi:hypothetical protein